MVQRLLFTTAAAAAAMALSAQAVLPDGFESRTAPEKQSFLFDQCKATAGTHGDYAGPGDLLAFFWRDINPTFDHMSEEMPYTRGKPIHEVGWVTTAKFIALENPFTGVFQGSDSVMLRLSLGQKGTDDHIVPGVGVKFLRSNIRSGNFVAMFALEGQTSLNFFANDFRNHIAEPSSAVLKLVAKKFETGSKPATFVGLSDLAKYGVNGEEVAAEELTFPFQLVLHPNAELNYKIDQLGGIKVGTKLWDVLAQATPTDTELIPIGSFTTTSELIQSKYGDNTLFFRHQRIEEDMALQPTWRKDISNPRALRCPLALN
jgi:hypothetical protein